MREATAFIAARLAYARQQKTSQVSQHNDEAKLDIKMFKCATAQVPAREGGDRDTEIQHTTPDGKSTHGLSVPQG